MKIVNPTAVLGENSVADFLRKKGYKILERNFRKGYGEIDIIAVDYSTNATLHSSGQAGILVFVEVKTRGSTAFGSPFESLLPSKIKTVVKTAQFYKYIHPDLPDEMRFDAIGVIVENKIVRSIEHLQNITGF